MTALQIVLSVIGGIAVLLLLLLFFGSVRIKTTINGEVMILGSILGIRRRLYPHPEPKEDLIDVSRCRHPERVLRKEEKRRRKALEKAERKRLKKKEEKPSAPAPAPNLKENLDMILALLKRAYKLTRGKLAIEFREMHLRVAAGDAAQTAILYGVVLQTSAYLLQWTEDHFNHVRRRDGAMTVEPDYLAAKPTAKLDLRISVRLFRAIGIGFQMLRAYSAERRRARRHAMKRTADAKNR